MDKLKILFMKNVKKMPLITYLEWRRLKGGEEEDHFVVFDRRAWWRKGRRSYGGVLGFLP